MMVCEGYVIFAQDGIRWGPGAMKSLGAVWKGSCGGG